MTPKDNFLKAMGFSEPEYVPHSEEEFVRVIFYNGAWPPHRGKCMWKITWDSRDERVLPLTIEHPIETIGDLYEYAFPNPEEFNCFSGLEEQISSIPKDEFLVGGGHPFVLFERAWSLVGMEKLLIWMLAEEEAVEYLLMKIANFQIEIAKYYLKLGVDIGWLGGDDYGSQNALIMSPALFRKYIKPELARIVSVYKEAGKMVFLHSCGCIMEIVQDLIDIGIDILNPIQASANDLIALKNMSQGKMTLWGGVDAATLMTGTLEDVEQEVRRRIEQLAPNGGYVISPDQGLPFPEANMETFSRAVRKYGKYPRLTS